MRRTKIVATVGPATSRPESMRALLAAGADVVRLNAAHAYGRRPHAARGAGRARPRPSSGRVGRRARRPARAEDAHRAGRRRRDPARGGRRARAHVGAGRRRRTPRLDHAARARALGRPGRRDLSSPTARSCCASNASTTPTSCARSCAAACCARARACTFPAPKRTSSRSPTTDAVALRMAIAIKADFVGLSFVRRPEDVEAVRARLPKRGHRPHARREDRDRGRARPPPRHRRRGRRGDGRARRSRHPGSGPARPADPKGDHPVLQHGRASP